MGDYPKAPYLQVHTASPRETTVSWDYGMSHNTTYLNIPYQQQSLCHAITTFVECCNIVHGGQHFPFLRNLFEPKPYDTNTLPKWQSGHIPIWGHLPEPSNRANRRILIYSKDTLLRQSYQNVHAGDNTSSLQRGIAKHCSPNRIVGKSHLYICATNGSVNSVEAHQYRLSISMSQFF